MSDYLRTPNQRLVFKTYSTRPHRCKYMIDLLISRFSDCEGASTSVNDTVIFDGISFLDARQIKNMLSPFGCYTVLENSDRGTPNKKQAELTEFLNRGNSSLRCIRCGSSNRIGAHGLFGTHPSRWRCKDCGWVWEY